MKLVDLFKLCLVAVLAISLSACVSRQEKELINSLGDKFEDNIESLDKLAKTDPESETSPPTVEAEEVDTSEVEGMIESAIFSDPEFMTDLIIAVHAYYREVDDDNLQEIQKLLKDIIGSDETYKAVRGLVVRDNAGKDLSEADIDSMLKKFRTYYLREIDKMELNDAWEWLSYVEIANSEYNRREKEGTLPGQSKS